MKQVLQNLGTGVTELADVPCPRPARGQILIRTTRTLISPGTERMLVDFGRANLLEKARQQPEKVKAVVEKVRTDGLAPTLHAVRNKLDQPLPMGYCNVGIVVEVGEGGDAFRVGDRVASNGRHAEIVSVPSNLCALVPDGVTDEAAAFTVMGAIALQGIRLVAPTLGEAVVVTGLGLIGLMTVQLLRAHGCRVLGVDMDETRVGLARSFGAETVNLGVGEDPTEIAGRFSRGRGVDAVILTAATRSSEPVHQAAMMSRKRGRIVLVGVTGLDLSRADFYEKELSFQVSCSYGPGRYDPEYEEKGRDYPVGFVRWTEQRNFEAVLDMMADGRLDVTPLISHRFQLADAVRAYDLVSSGEESLGIVLEYAGPEKIDAELLVRRVPVTAAARETAGRPQGTASPRESPVVGFIGAGNYGTAVLIPAFKAAGATLASIASSAGVSGTRAARKFGITETTTDTANVLDDPSINAVVIITRHDSHARYVIAALERGKHVFVEKPLCLSLAELDEISAVYARADGARLMVGYNRRFAPHIIKMKELLEPVSEPKAFVMTINAGSLPPEHWAQDPAVGGGRVLGEATHFIDLLRFLAGAPIVSHARVGLEAQPQDTVTLQLAFADGSIGTVHYLSNGSKAFPKERLEVFAQGRVLQLNNFRRMRGFGWPGFRNMNLWQQDKGQKACAAAFVECLRTGSPAPIAFDEIAEVTRVSVELGATV